MKNILINISGKIDPSYTEAIGKIHEITESAKIQFFIIGARARDFILEMYYGIRAPRMTNDIDLGIRVKNWKEYDSLIDRLIKTGAFKLTNQKHRVCYKNVYIDVIPFGDIRDKDFKIAWPPKHDIVMSVLGFDEVFQNSTTIRLHNKPPLDVKIATLPGLALLKLLSWKDQYPERKKDAQDLLFIMSNYEHADNLERLYSNEQKLLEDEAFDITLSSAKLLGIDMCRLCSQTTKTLVTRILEEETNEESKFNLVIDMMDSLHNFDASLELIKKLKEGFLIKS